MKNIFKYSFLAALLIAMTGLTACQNEELDRLHETKDHLEARISFLLEQIAIKDRRMDEKDAWINRLMEKVL